MKNKLVIYFPSVGRRVELIQNFYSAAEELDIALTIIGSDNSELAPGLNFVDYSHFIHPIHSVLYEDNLAAIIKHYKVNLVIPTLDPELIKFSQISKKFSQQFGVRFIISDKSVINTFSSKIQTQVFAVTHNIKVPKSYRLGTDNFELPMIAKPDMGSSSVGIHRIETELEFNDFAIRKDQYIFQKYIEGTEYTVDAFVDSKGQSISIVPRIRLKIRAGEISKGQISMDESIIKATQKILSLKRFYGPITLQFIKKNTGELYLIEVNPRFGGGAPMTIKAGANTPLYLMKDYFGMKFDLDQINVRETKFARYDMSVEVKGFD